MEHSTAYGVARELQLERSGRRAVMFHGKSMFPFLDEGDDVIVEPVEWAAIRPGDVITCRLDDRFPTYRVVRRRRGRLTLRGDNWPGPRFTAWPDDVLGRAVVRRRDGTILTARHFEWRWRALLALVRYWQEAVLGRIRTEWRAARQRVRTAWTRRANVPGAVHVNMSGPRQLSEETFQKLLPTLAHARMLHVEGAGEPLTNGNLMRFLRFARSANPGLEIDLTTDATLLSETIVRDLIALPLDCLTVSIEATRPESVARRRAGLDLEVVVGNVGRFNRLKQAARASKPILRVNYALGHGSYDELPEFVRMAKRTA